MSYRKLLKRAKAELDIGKKNECEPEISVEKHGKIFSFYTLFTSIVKTFTE